MLELSLSGFVLPIIFLSGFCLLMLVALVLTDVLRERGFSLSAALFGNRWPGIRRSF